MGKRRKHFTRPSRDGAARPQRTSSAAPPAPASSTRPTRSRNRRTVQDAHFQLGWSKIMAGPVCLFASVRAGLVWAVVGILEHVQFYRLCNHGKYLSMYLPSSVKAGQQGVGCKSARNRDRMDGLSGIRHGLPHHLCLLGLTSQRYYYYSYLPSTALPHTHGCSLLTHHQPIDLCAFWFVLPFSFLLFFWYHGSWFRCCMPQRIHLLLTWKLTCIRYSLAAIAPRPLQVQGLGFCPVSITGSS